MTAAAVVLVVAQLTLRAWATYGGWFYGDDLKFLSEAATEPLTLEYLFTRHQQQLMPAGLLLAWLVGQGPVFSWTLAATSIIVMQALASIACVVMLFVLFGRRPAVLLPLALYLFSPLTLGAFMWWAAALNQLPLQVAAFGILTTHVLYLRTSHRRWAAVSAGIFLIALLFYVKAVVIIPLVALLTLGYFVEGSARARLVSTLRRHWLVWLGYAAIAGGYLIGYTRTGSSPVGDTGDAFYLETADRQVRENLGPTLLGGPWRWLDQGRQDVLTDAPDVAITASWVVLVGLVAVTCWVRPGAWRAWALLAIYLVPTVFLTANGRAPFFGPDVGLYVRYLTDVAVVACLALALATTPLRGLPDQPARGLRPERSWRVPAAAVAVVFAVGSIWSTVDYVRYWHVDGPAERWIAEARVSLQPLDAVDFADVPVPPELVLDANQPFDRPSRLLAPLGLDLRPVDAGTDLQAFGKDGRLQQVVVVPGISADLPASDGCPVAVTDRRTTTVPLEGEVTDESWWTSIEYLASRDGELRVSIDGVVQRHPVREGPHTLTFRTSAGFDSVRIQSATPSLNLCIDDITVGFLDTFS